LPPGLVAPSLPPQQARRESKRLLACATEMMEGYRQELAYKKKGSSKFVPPL